jgi:hypothetical protein
MTDLKPDHSTNNTWNNKLMKSYTASLKKNMVRGLQFPLLIQLLGIVIVLNHHPNPPFQLLVAYGTKQFEQLMSSHI